MRAQGRDLRQREEANHRAKQLQLLAQHLRAEHGAEQHVEADDDYLAYRRSMALLTQRLCQRTIATFSG